MTVDRRDFLRLGLQGSAAVVASTFLIGCGRRPEAFARSRIIVPPAEQSGPLPQQQGLRYVVQAGDTLSAISRRGKISVQTIIQYNQLTSHVIHPGDVLILPHVRHLGTDPLEQAKQSRQAGQSNHSGPNPRHRYRAIIQAPIAWSVVANGLRQTCALTNEKWDASIASPFTTQAITVDFTAKAIVKLSG